MNLQQYQQEVARTCATSDPRETLLMANFGLAGEVGEIADHIKKNQWHGHDLDIEHVKKEIGDVLWYVSTLCNALDISLDDVIAGNVEKLRKRYPDGFSSERSVNREEGKK